jgi:hypothetical protein
MDTIERSDLIYYRCFDDSTSAMSQTYQRVVCFRSFWTAESSGSGDQFLKEAPKPKKPVQKMRIHFSLFQYTFVQLGFSTLFVISLS